MQPLLFDNRKTMFVQKYGRLFVDKLISTEQVFGVVSLKQLCRYVCIICIESSVLHYSLSIIRNRCTIREILRVNYQLPRGIEKLRLPRHLQRYVDLMEK